MSLKKIGNNKRQADLEYTRFLDRLSHEEDIKEPQKHEIARYLAYGETPGPGLQTIICNDLSSAMFHIDTVNPGFFVTSPGFFQAVKFFHDFADRQVYGSEERMRGWMKKKQEELAGPTLEQKQQAVVASLYLKDKVELQQAAEEILLELFSYLNNEEVDEYYNGAISLRKSNESR